jgi:molybdate transport system regulatory protein
MVMVNTGTLEKDSVALRIKEQSVESPYKIRGNIWVEKEGRKYICERNVELLEQIDRLGSMAAAARNLGMGYRTAWIKVDEMNRLSPRLLVIKLHGGAGGGQAILTADGQRVIEEYRETMIQFNEFLGMCKKKGTLS